MNKKIFIASLFASLILLVPMTSVVGVSEVEDDCGCQVVNRYDLFRVKFSLLRLKIVANILLLRFGHIPEIREKCQEILDDISSVGINDWFCDNLISVYYSTYNRLLYFIQKFEDAGGELAGYIYGFLILSSINIL
jgi:hypothetical protein